MAVLKCARCVAEQRTVPSSASSTTDIYEHDVLPTEDLERTNENPCDTENQEYLKAQIHESGSLNEEIRSCSKENSLTATEKEPKTPQPGPSYQRPSTPLPQISTFKLTSPSNIMPVPRTTQTKRKVRKGGKTAILTESPYKNELLETIKATENKKLKTEVTKQKVFSSGKEAKAKGKGQQKPKKQNKSTLSDQEESDDGSDVECLYCGYLYSQSTEEWITCGSCRRWAGEDDNDEECSHICEYCKK
ncbi:hypothetical protein RN001_015949 [Aquatica leii]|uniref:Uncharacterized protein n=1 Tax=Aquatica leii TaxID=1421715 RepID=A0AAN7NTV4_9COLE|nr:hypothetical protein RN001_015949 [Aquatica leii]